MIMGELIMGGYKEKHGSSQMYCGKCKHWHRLELTDDDRPRCPCKCR
jgi:hypothetical protein